MRAVEITVPETTPETEWVRGRALQKVSPRRDHARLQAKLAAALDAWAADGRGEVGSEWRFRVTPPGEASRPLVPDIAFVAAGALRGRSHAEIQIPTLPPTVVVEIVSPSDERADVASKIDVYLRAGTHLVVIVDPQTRSVELHDGAIPQTLGSGATLRHAALPGFALELGAYFDAALRLIE